jgi:imidazoleglycerol-phosphate dehydratase
MDVLRKGEINRVTQETNVSMTIYLDGGGLADIDTGIPFFDHMLNLFTVHSLCDLTLQAQGDIEVDDHHTIEDVGICLGEALKKALGDKRGINRYGEFTLPMDESLVRVVLDFSGRSYLNYNLPIPAEKLGDMAAENVREFFQALANSAGMNIHVDLIRGTNSHHIVEAAFKALGRAIKMAVALEPRISGVWSSKGVL